MSSIPVREMVKNAVKSTGGKTSYKKIIEWITKNYGDINHGTIRAQTIACSVNQYGRIHYPENKKPRESDPRYDLFYSTGRGEVELFEPEKHGDWGIVEYQGKPRITHNGKRVSKTDIEEFFFIEKDFESTTSKKEDAQYLYDRFKILYNVLKNTLSDSFNDAESYVGRPFNQGSRQWTEYQWLGFSRKNTFHETKYDSIQFQISLNKKDDLSVMIWLDGNAKSTKIHALDEIKNNQENFVSLLNSLPSSYYVGIRGKGENDNQKISLAELTPEFIENIKSGLSQKKF